MDVVPPSISETHSPHAHAGGASSSALVLSQPGVSLARPTKPPTKRERHEGDGDAPRPSKAVRQVSDLAKARTQHNNAVRRDGVSSEAARALYLKRNIDKLRPFVTEQIAHSIVAKGESAMRVLSHEPVPEPVEEQPEQILGTMREYQIQVPCAITNLILLRSSMLCPHPDPVPLSGPFLADEVLRSWCQCLPG